MTECLNKSKLYVIFFSSSDFVSKTIRWFDSCWLSRPCAFSHSGILFHKQFLSLKLYNYLCQPNDEFLVIESTLSGRLNDCVYNTCKQSYFGVQIRSLTELLNSYKNQINGSIAVCEIDIPNTPNTFECFSSILQKYLQKKYERKLPNLFLVHMPIFPAFKSNTFFCSELVYRILKDLKVKIQKRSAKKVSPNSLINYANLKSITYLVV